MSMCERETNKLQAPNQGPGMLIVSKKQGSFTDDELVSMETVARCIYLGGFKQDDGRSVDVYLS